jgi:hypothetical protein
MIEAVLQEMVRQTIAEQYAPPQMPEFITVQEAADLCACDRSVISSLIQNPSSGFPAIRLSKRVIKIDKCRLIRWLESGGLGLWP